MSDRSVIPAASVEPGARLHGFVVTAVTPVEDIKALVYEARHERTGAELVCVHAHDEENLFSVGFRTPPPDSTGVAHILEHSVLAGSERYPVKDAFNELGKRTLNTFLNAMTWPDRTVYPTASAVRADYFNLASVYLDLVFHPRLAEDTFRQEGHHLELEDLDDPDSPLKISGVVYNEMKGANSSPERIYYRQMLGVLCEDTPYSYDSGGDPAVMPQLTYENFVNFHRRFYSPSNARFFLYGDVGLEENLAFLEERLARFERVEVDSSLPLQPRWSEPRRQEVFYSVGREDPTDARTFVTVNWLCNEITDVETSLLMEIAVDALSSSAGSPMRKALIDSGLGQAVFPSGAYGGSGRQTTCSFGLRGTEPEHAEAIENLILDTLRRVVDEGLDPEAVEASFHQVEFGGKEISPPFPIMLLMRAAPMWYFGADPKDGLRFSTLMEQARRRYEADPRVFEKLLQTWLIDNPHRLTQVLAPRAGLSAEQEAELAREMAQRRAAMRPEEVEAIRQAALALRAQQEEPDSPEALASLPQLTVEQIPREVRTFPAAVSTTHDGVTVLEHRSFSNGVGYVGLSFDIRDLGDDDAVLLPFMGRATRGLGAGGRGYEQMATRIDRYTGGVGLGPFNGRHLTTGERFEQLSVDGSVLTRNAPVLFDILRELLLESDTSDQKRIRDMLLESATRSVSAVVPSGHAYARSRAAAGLDAVHWRAEQWGGLTQIRWLKARANDAAAAAAELSTQIKALQERIFTRSRVIVSLAGDPEIVDVLRPLAERFLADLPQGTPVNPAPERVPELPREIGVAIPAAVNYVVEVCQTVNMLDAAAPALELLANVLRSELLYKKLRVQGGAYGGFAGYAKDSGLFSLLSYRDPRLVETFAVYESVVDWLRSDAFTDEMVDASRIGTIGSYDALLTAAQQLGVGRRRHFLGLDDTQRKRFRDGLFTTTAEDIRQLAIPHLEAFARGTAPRGVCAPAEALEAANEKLTRKLVIEPLEG